MNRGDLTEDGVSVLLSTATEREDACLAEEVRLDTNGL